VLLISDPGNLERKLAVAVKLDLVKPLKLEPRSKNQFPFFREVTVTSMEAA
jgi:hypothetical protein